uniref:Uncharacterized protein n=1 Tax=Aegilops tauschii subsp. strangulata TaxID=200361 RepID=A0A453NT68_AEGTS
VEVFGCRRISDIETKPSLNSEMWERFKCTRDKEELTVAVSAVVDRKHANGGFRSCQFQFIDF